MNPRPKKPTEPELPEPLEGVGIRDRRRMAKSLVWLDLAMTAQRWSDDIRGSNDDVRPFAEWGPTDPHVRMAHVLRFTPDQLADLLEQVAQLCEDKADRLGYDDVPPELTD